MCGRCCLRVGPVWRPLLGSLYAAVRAMGCGSPRPRTFSGQCRHGKVDPAVFVQVIAMSLDTEESSVKPSAQPALVRTQHLSPPAEMAPDQRIRGQGLILSCAAVWDRRHATGDMRPETTVCGSPCPIRAHVRESALRALVIFMAWFPLDWSRPRCAAWPLRAVQLCTWRRPAPARPHCGLPIPRPGARVPRR